MQQPIGNAAGRKLRTDDDATASGWNRDGGRQFPIELVSENLNRCGITGTGVPRTLA